MKTLIIEDNKDLIQNTARCCLATTKIRAGEFLPKVSEVLLDDSLDRVGFGCNITMV